MTGFAQLFNATRSAPAGDGAQTIVRFNAASQGKDGLHRQVKIRGFAVDVDEPSVRDLFNNATPVRIAIAAPVAAQSPISSSAGRPPRQGESGHWRVVNSLS